MRPLGFLSTLFRVTLLSSAVLSAPSSFSQSDRPIHPANSGELGYAELDDLPDWSGIWQPSFGQVSGDQPQLKGEYLEYYEAEMAKVASIPGYEIPEKGSNCLPVGMPGMMTMPYSLEFLFTPGKIVINQEALMQVRRVFTDGRDYPEFIDPNFFGYSLGHWEGDTLVIETKGTQAGQRLGVQGITNGPNLTISERIYIDSDNPDLMHLEFTLNDPDVLSAPWHRNHTFRRDRNWEIIEYVCAQNDRHPIGVDGQTRADLDN
jgi:hypothetical protein